jgi:transposase-like protein
MTKQVRSTSSFGPMERRKIIEEYLQGGKSKATIWRQYTGQRHERGQLLRWMKQLDYLDNTVSEELVSLPPMSEEENKPRTKEELEARIKQLERQLQDSQLKEEAYRRMIDIAEKDLKISIRKKPNTK